MIQQVGTPTDIYDHPANTFVASFIGSPAMNLIEGTAARAARSTGDGIERHGTHRPRRQRDARASGPRMRPSCADGGQIAAPVYAVELLGEASMITWRLGEALVSVKTAKDYRAETGQMVQASVPAAICHLFDTATGERIPGAAAMTPAGPGRGNPRQVITADGEGAGRQLERHGRRISTRTFHWYGNTGLRHQGRARRRFVRQLAAAPARRLHRPHLPHPARHLRRRLGLLLRPYRGDP